MVREQDIPEIDHRIPENLLFYIPYHSGAASTECLGMLSRVEKYMCNNLVKYLYIYNTKVVNFESKKIAQHSAIRHFGEFRKWQSTCHAQNPGSNRFLLSTYTSTSSQGGNHLCKSSLYLSNPGSSLH